MNVILLLTILFTASTILIARRPDGFRITRKTVINAPAAKVFEQVNDLQKWQAWSPWAKLDPTARNSFEGPIAGTGAKTSWVGNNKVGSGSMTITQSLPAELVVFRLEFLKPFIATNTAEFTFTTENNATTVTWSMFGTNSFKAKAITLIMNCDKMVGGQFEKGLADLKKLVEAQG